MKKNVKIELKGELKGVHICPDCEWHNICPTEMDYKEIWACVQFKSKLTAPDRA